MIYSNTTLVVLLTFICLISGFIATIYFRSKRLTLLHKLYFSASFLLLLWFLALIGLYFVSPDNQPMQELLDGITYLGGTMIPVCSLLFAIAYVCHYDQNMPVKYWWLFLLPLLTNIMVWTNPLHHLFYSRFSLQNTEVEFGPYFPVHVLYTYGCTFIAVAIVIRYAFKTRTRLHIYQAILFVLGGLAPSVMNLLVMLKVIPSSILATPLSFILTIFFHGFIILRLHFFDIKPLAMQQLLDCISTCFMVTDTSGLVINYNPMFLSVFGNRYHIRENVYLKDCLPAEDTEQKSPMYHLVSALASCQESQSRISYEQSLMLDGKWHYYVIEITPLMADQELCGFLSLLNDVTELKDNMQKLQDNQIRLMERERLAFLGQMVGGLAHNLKTPIMSISGSNMALQNLLREARVSTGDPEVTPEDFLEIYADMDVWFERIQEACSYMSEIITAVKGQASNMNESEETAFSMDEVFKRVALLLRHEIMAAHCELVLEAPPDLDIVLYGDINNLVQVLNNLVSNALMAQKPEGDHRIILSLGILPDALQILVTDYGVGVPASVKQKLFKQMVTSKGTLGTGLGIFISNTVIHAKFSGEMWQEDNPDGGSIFGISIPKDKFTIQDRKQVNHYAQE